MNKPASAQFGTFFKPKDSVERYVSVTVHMFPPYRPFLAEYADTRADQLLVRMVLNDLSMCYEQVLVKITLESMGVTWKSDSRVFSFSGNWMLELNGADFIPFFASINAPQNISKTGMLHYAPDSDPYRIPDGLYRIGFEISGFGSNMRPTQIYTPYYPFFLEDPPKLLIPKNKDVVISQPVQNIRFEWKPLPSRSENIDKHVKVTYHLDIFESQIDTDYSTATPDWTHATTESSYTLTANHYTLQPGTRYVWRIRVTTDSDATYFHNDGYSDISVFEYK